MSDSFADLWSSTAPARPVPQKLGSATSTSSRNDINRPKNDVFSLLSSAASSAPVSRPITPSIAGQASKTAPKPISGGGDVFSSLLSGSLGGISNNSTNLTMAERAAKVAKEREQRAQQTASAAPVASAWAGLDSLAKPTSYSSVKHASSSPLPVDDWIFDSPAPRAAAASIKPPSPALVEEDWGLGDFSSAPSTSGQSQQHRPLPSSSPNPSHSQNIWDIDQTAVSNRPASRKASTPTPPPRREANPEEDFDFGDGAVGLLDSQDQSDDEDILGILGKPASKRLPVTVRHQFLSS